jgi:hypothetical protein
MEMLKVINIKTRETIITGSNRVKLQAKAIKILGKEGYAIRPLIDEVVVTPANWCESDGQWWV